MRLHPFKTPTALANRKHSIKLHAKLANELGRKLRVSIPAVRKPANLRRA